MFTVVKGAAVLVAVAMHGAKEAFTPAREPCQPNLLLTHLAFIFLFLPCILVWAGWVQVLRGRRPALFPTFTLLRRCPAHLREGWNRGLSSGSGSRRGLVEGGSWGGRARGCRRGGRGHTGGWLLFLLESILVALRAEPISVRGPKEATASAAQNGSGLQLIALSLHPPVNLLFSSCQSCGLGWGGQLLGCLTPLFLDTCYLPSAHPSHHTHTPTRTHTRTQCWFAPNTAAADGLDWTVSSEVAALPTAVVVTGYEVRSGIPRDLPHTPTHTLSVLLVLVC